MPEIFANEDFPSQLCTAPQANTPADISGTFNSVAEHDEEQRSFAEGYPRRTRR